LTTDPLNVALRDKYSKTGRFYDLLDYPFELMYRSWRPGLLSDVRGRVLEAGVGTGHNLPFYHESVSLCGVDLSPVMLARAQKKSKQARCEVELKIEDATELSSLADNEFDWVFSTFMCCVMPDDLQPQALKQFARVLKPGGKFRLLEVVFSGDSSIEKWQRRASRLVEKLYGARLDRQTVAHIEAEPGLKVTNTRYLKWGSYLLIDGVAVP